MKRFLISGIFIAVAIAPAMAQLPPTARGPMQGQAGPPPQVQAPDPLAAVARESEAFNTAQQHFIEAIRDLAQAHQREQREIAASAEALAKKDQEWRAAFTAWCGERPACGLESSLKGK